jgi:tetratricopeptide (TPR) repeat protein
MRELLGEAGENRDRCGHLLVALALTDQLDLPEPIAPEESGPFIIEDLPRIRRDGESQRPPSARPPLRETGSLPGKEKLLADSAFLQGKELLRAGEYGAAADAFREASNLRPSALEYALFAAWSAYLSTGRAVKWRDMLVELCERTLAQDRHLAFAYHVRGQLALEVKELSLARESLKRALELDPQDDEARRLLSRLSN